MLYQRELWAATFLPFYGNSTFNKCIWSTTACAELPKLLYAPVWNDLAHQPLYNSTKMHELDLTEEPSLPPSLFPPPSIFPFLSSLDRGHAPALLRSDAAAFGKINGAIWRRSWTEMTSGELKGEVLTWVYCCLDPSAVIIERGTQREDRRLCVRLGPRKWPECERQCQLWEVCTALQLHDVQRPLHTLFNAWKWNYTQQYPHSRHPSAKLSVSRPCPLRGAVPSRRCSHSPAGGAECRRADGRAQLPAVPKPRLPTTHLHTQQEKLSTVNTNINRWLQTQWNSEL